MTKEQKEQIIELVDRFCRENIGNKMNAWLEASMRNETRILLNSMIEPEKKPTSIEEIEQKKKEGEDINVGS